MNNSAKPSFLSAFVRQALVLTILALLAGCGRPPKPAAPGLPSPREQAAIANGWLKERFDTILPALMRREKIDMWIVVCREHA